MSRTLAVILLLLVAVACTPAVQEAPEPEEATTPESEAAPESETAADRATLAEATALLERAIAHYDQVGREQALADFTAGEAPFVDRDLYVFCYGPDRTISAHGADANLIGTDIDSLRDVDGRAFASEIMEVGGQPGGGTVAYQWANPVTGAIEPKVSVVRAVGVDVCGVGAYRVE